MNNLVIFLLFLLIFWKGFDKIIKENVPKRNDHWYMHRKEKVPLEHGGNYDKIKFRKHKYRWKRNNEI